jgi:hypothetical protein
MHIRISTFVALVLALGVGSASALQVYGVFDSALDNTGPAVYPLSIQDLMTDAKLLRAAPIAVPSTEVPVPPGTFSGFACVVSAAPGAGKGWTFQLLKNGVATTLACSVSNSTSVRSCADAADADGVTLASGDRVALQVTPVSTPSAASGRCTLLFK